MAFAVLNIESNDVDIIRYGEYIIDTISSDKFLKYFNQNMNVKLFAMDEFKCIAININDNIASINDGASDEDVEMVSDSGSNASPQSFVIFIVGGILGGIICTVLCGYVIHKYTNSGFIGKSKQDLEENERQKKKNLDDNASFDSNPSEQSNSDDEKSNDSLALTINTNHKKQRSIHWGFTNEDDKYGEIKKDKTVPLRRSKTAPKTMNSSLSNNCSYHHRSNTTNNNELSSLKKSIKQTSIPEQDISNPLQHDDISTVEMNDPYDILSDDGDTCISDILAISETFSPVGGHSNFNTNAAMTANPPVIGIGAHHRRARTLQMESSPLKRFNHKYISYHSSYHPENEVNETKRFRSTNSNSSMETEDLFCNDAGINGISTNNLLPPKSHEGPIGSITVKYEHNYSSPKRPIEKMGDDMDDFDDIKQDDGDCDESVVGSINQSSSSRPNGSLFESDDDTQHSQHSASCPPSPDDIDYNDNDMSSSDPSLLDDKDHFIKQDVNYKINIVPKLSGCSESELPLLPLSPLPLLPLSPQQSEKDSVASLPSIPKSPMIIYPLHQNNNDNDDNLSTMTITKITECGSNDYQTTKDGQSVISISPAIPQNYWD